MSESNPEHQPLLRPENIERTPVFPIIHMIRADMMYCIDTPLSFEALTAPELTYSLVRPLLDKYAAIQQAGNMSVVFCLLLNRVYFLGDDNVTTASVSRTRAILCEILATRIFRQLADMYSLALTLTTTWSVYSGADPGMIAQARQERDDDLEDRVGNAIEMAILGRAKKFIKSSACQKVINAIWSGRCVYQAESSHSILSDTYKRTPIHFYDPHKAPILDHYRLKVPAVRSVLEYMNFVILFILFVIAIEFSERDKLNVPEVIFMVYALGFSLEKIAAMQEHGIRVYSKGTWNGFDIAFVTLYCIYAFLRLYGAYHHKEWACTLGIDLLAIVASFMFTRLAFVTFKDNLMVLALRAMFMQFLALMLIAAFCFCGFLYGLWTLSRNDAGYSADTITWWMLDLYFGLDASGFDRAGNFHPVFGPVLMITYACLSNTLLLTVLVSILSNTFAHINEDAAAEAMFRKAVSTIEGVKADSLFSYQPPINLLALCIMLPASYVLSPRWFHKVNVFMIRITSFPVLLLIAWYERQAKKAETTGFYDTLSAVIERLYDALPRSLKRMTLFEGLAGSQADIDVIFEIDEEYDSALETGDALEPTDIQVQRRKSTTSSPRTPLKQTQHTPSQSSDRPTIPRLRVDSLFARPLNMAQSFASPLAQMYPPVVEVESIPEEGPGQESSNGTPKTGVSGIPFARKRLMSIAPQPPARRGNMGAPGKSDGQEQRTSGPSTPEKSQVKAALSQSPEQMGHEPKASEIEEGPPVDFNFLSQQLEEMEKRQSRIESLLGQIASKL